MSLPIHCVYCNLTENQVTKSKAPFIFIFFLVCKLYWHNRWWMGMNSRFFSNLVIVYDSFGFTRAIYSAMQVTSPVGSHWIRSFCTKIAVNITILIHHHCKSSLGISIAFHLFNVVKGICKNVLYLKYSTSI